MHWNPKIADHLSLHAENLKRSDSAGPMNGNNLNGPMGGIKIKPSPSPKPDSLHGRAIYTSGAPNGASDPLKDRLAALRTAAGALDTNRPGSRASTGSSTHNSPASTLSMPNSNDYGGRNSFETATPRPQGPRPQPAPPIPGKHPLDTTFAASMPGSCTCCSLHVPCIPSLSVSQSGP